MKKPSECQVGGEHYKTFAIQPGEFCQKNALQFCEANIVKYACRHRSKGKAEDVRKIIHYARLLLEWEYGEIPAESCPVKTSVVSEPGLADTQELPVNFFKNGVTQQSQGLAT